jgi:hypothetical protein
MYPQSSKWELIRELTDTENGPVIACTSQQFEQLSEVYNRLANLISSFAQLDRAPNTVVEGVFRGLDRGYLGKGRISSNSDDYFRFFSRTDTGEVNLVISNFSYYPCFEVCVRYRVKEVYDETT